MMVESHSNGCSKIAAPPRERRLTHPLDRFAGSRRELPIVYAASKGRAALPPLTLIVRVVRVAARVCPGLDLGQRPLQLVAHAVERDAPEDEVLGRVVRFYDPDDRLGRADRIAGLLSAVGRGPNKLLNQACSCGLLPGHRL